MIEIKISPKFKRSYKLRVKPHQLLRTEFKEALGILISQQNLDSIYDHKLVANMSGKRAFSINKDFRVVYKQTKDYILLLDIGNHSQVYPKFRL